MTLRTRFLITALVLCHQLLLPKLVTSQLLARSAGKPVPVSDEQAGSKVAGPCAEQAAKVQDERIPTICAIQQEKIGDIYHDQGNVENHKNNYILPENDIPNEHETV